MYKFQNIWFKHVGKFKHVHWSVVETVRSKLLFLIQTHVGCVFKTGLGYLWRVQLIDLVHFWKGVDFNRACFKRNASQFLFHWTSYVDLFYIISCFPAHSSEFFSADEKLRFSFEHLRKFKDELKTIASSVKLTSFTKLTKYFFKVKKSYINEKKKE